MRKIAYLLLTVAIFVSVNAFAQEQEQKTPTPEEMAAKEADRFRRVAQAGRLADILCGFHIAA